MGRKRKGVVDEAQDAGVVAGFDWENACGIHPEVVELCDHFHIDEFHTKKLHDTLSTRQATFDEDMLRLWTDLEEARNPNGLLISQMKQMDEGSFVGQCKPDPEMTHLVKKFELDKESTKRLTDCVCRHPIGKRMGYYAELEVHLEVSNRPSAAAMMLLRKIKDGQPLGQPERKGGGKGGGKDKDRDEAPRGKGGGYDRRDGDRDDRRGGGDRGRSRSYNRQDRGRDDRDRGRGRDYDDRSGGGRDDRDRGGGRGYDDRRDDRDRGGDRDYRGGGGSDRDRDSYRDRW